MATDGYVAVHEAGVGSQAMAAFQQLEDQHRLPIRVYEAMAPDVI